MPHKILIVDDDPVQLRLLSGIVKKVGHICIEATGGEEAMNIIEGSEGEDLALIILDLIMPDIGGMEVMERLQQKEFNKPIVVQTAQGGIDTVINSMRLGAVDFVVKPVSPERLQVSIQNALKVKSLEGEIKRIKRTQKGKLTFNELIKSSQGMQNVVRLGKRAAQSNIPILLEGESGVGKEVIANAIQGESDRSGKPFIIVNCGAIPENLVESTLFGHEKGAFTGANDKHAGKFVEANGGTLFLDEVSELPLDAQVKLLRALQEGEVDPVGAKRPVKVDIRLVSATNRNMIEHVKSGKFREDLYYRLNVYPIMIPPLRQRTDDIPELVNLFITRFSIEEGKKVDGVSDDALDMLVKYNWPGNVRQLENTLFRAVVLAENNILHISEFPQIAAGFSEYSQTNIDHINSPNLIGQSNTTSLSATVSNPGMIGGNVSNHLNIIAQNGEIRTIDEIEADIIEMAIDRYRGRMSEVAKRLGIGRSTLYRKIKEMNIPV